MLFGLALRGGRAAHAWHVQAKAQIGVHLCDAMDHILGERTERADGHVSLVEAAQLPVLCPRCLEPLREVTLPDTVIKIRPNQLITSC